MKLILMRTIAAVFVGLFLAAVIFNAVAFMLSLVL
jgi:hypothetical protein